MMTRRNLGFTLIELSIVLVIIGLIVGGVLVGRDLIKAAQLRALVSQVDQFKIATNLFKGKYGALPGDISPSETAKFNMFTFTGVNAGLYPSGDNNGVIHGAAEMYCYNECGAFWRHLSDAGLIATIGQTLEADTTAGSPGAPAGETQATPFSFSLYMPAAKAGFGFVGAGTLEFSGMSGIPGINTSQNLFYVVPAAKAERNSAAEPSLSAINMYSIDSKIDDGQPYTGKMITSVYEAVFTAQHYYWSDGATDFDGNPLDSNSKACTIGGADSLQLDVRYNTNPGTGANNVTCIPLFLW